MKKIVLSISFILIAVFMFSTCSYAEGNTSNNIKKVIDGTQNKMEDASKGAADAAKQGVDNVKNGFNNMKNTVNDSAKETGDNLKKGADNVGNAIQDGAEGLTRDDPAYTANRTAANGNYTTTGVLNTETWSWIIIGVVAVAIIALFWYYATRTRNDRNQH